MLDELKYGNCYAPLIGLSLDFNKQHMVNYGYVWISIRKSLFVVFHFPKRFIKNLLSLIDYMIFVKYTDFPT